jgi:hypothetical protein
MCDYRYARRCILLRIVSADSSSAILNDNFEPICLVASSAVLVCQPYREADDCEVKPLFISSDNGHEAIVHEAELCRTLLAKTKADIVHLDMSLQAIPVKQLSPITFSNMRIPGDAKQQLIRILPRLRKIACEITQKYGIEMLAIGKESMPVRIAELTSGAHAILFTCAKAIEEKKSLMLGLPSKCQFLPTETGICLCSLIGAEHDVRGFAEDKHKMLKKVNITEMLNPIARGFRTLKITPET